MEFLRQFTQGLVQLWLGLSASARVILAVFFVVSAIAISAVVYFGARPQYVELASNLSAEDMVAVQSRLDAEGVPWKIDSAGKTIYVPLQHRSEMKVKINGAGIVSAQGSVPGFEFLDRASPMLNQRMQDINYQRALMGELKRQLEQYSFVNHAFVVIREAEDELFTSEQKPSTASVTLDVNQPLTEEQVNAVLGTITTFGGANLRREHVNLATTKGEILNAPAEDEFDSIANSKLTYARNYRNELKKEAERALRQLGVRSVVTVAIDVDHSSSTEERQEVSKGVPVSSYTVESKTSSGEAPPGGPAGARANLPADATPPGGTQTTVQEEQTLENIEPSRTTIRTVRTPGDVTVKRVTAIVEGKYRDKVDASGAATGEREYVPRSKEELESYKALVAAATNVQDENIEVRDQPFELEHLAAATSAFEAAETGTALARAFDLFEKVGSILLVVALILLVRWLALRAAVSRDAVRENELVLEVAKPGPEEMRKRQIATEIERASTEQPDTVASLLRTWLSEAED